MPDLPAVRHRTEPPRSTRLDVPRDTRRLRRPHLEDDAFGRFAERFARFMGTAKFLMYMTLFVLVWMLWNVLMPADLRFDEAANTIYQFAWSRFCDWYLELIKPVQGAEIDARPALSPGGCSTRSWCCSTRSCRSSPRSCGTRWARVSTT